MLSKQKGKPKTAEADQATANAMQAFVAALRGDSKPSESPKELSLISRPRTLQPERPFYFVI